MKTDVQMEELKKKGFQEIELHSRQTGLETRTAVYDENEKCFVHPGEADIEVRVFRNEDRWKTYLNLEKSVMGEGTTPQKSIEDALKDLKCVYEKEKSRLLNLLEKLKK